MFQTNCNLRRISKVSLVAAVIILSGCRFLSKEATAPTYSSISTVSGLQDVDEPFGIAVRDGAMFFSDGGAGTIRRVDADGNATTIASGLNTPSAIAFLPSGDLVVADTGSHTIRLIKSDGSVHPLAGIANVAGSKDGPIDAATFNGPVGIAVSDDGSIFVSDTYSDRIRMIRDGSVTTIAGDRRGFADGVGPSASFDTPLGIAVWGDKLLVADSGNAGIRIVEMNGVVTTLAGGRERDLIDGPLASATFVDPAAVAVSEGGAIFVADGNAIRVIGRRVFPNVETLAGNRRVFTNGYVQGAQFSRPSGLALGANHELYIADSDNHAIRILADSGGPNEIPRPSAQDRLPLATRWPFDPPSNPREVAGTLGEIRGVLGPNDKPTWFHNGLDIAGAYGETTKFIRDETVLDPHAAENFGTARELLRLPLIGYIHLRLGRDKDDRPFGDPRFQFERDTSGKLTGVRVPRGAKFVAGEVIGTLNAMNHVHLIAGRSGNEINALAALDLPGIADSIPPVIEAVSVFTDTWQKLPANASADKMRVVVRAYDRMDGNSERRRLGVYRVGYQVLQNGTPIGDVKWQISFELSPSNDAVRFAYAEGSRSGYTPDTIFDYIATNQVDGENAREEFLDTTNLAPGRYTVRVFVADYFGRTATKDVELVK